MGLSDFWLRLQHEHRRRTRTVRERGLTYQPLFRMFLWYLGGSLVGYWFYIYEAVMHSGAEGMAVAFFVLYMLYQALTLLLCLVWFLVDREAQLAEERRPPAPTVLASLYMQRWVRAVPSFAPEEKEEDVNVVALARYLRHSRYYHLVVMQVLSAAAVVNLGVGIFFLAYAHLWEAYAICAGLQCYPALVVLPLLCYALYQVMYHERRPSEGSP